MIINIIPKPKGPFSLQEISKEINCTYISKNMNISINDISSLESAKEGDLSFLDNLKYLKNLNNCKASAIIIPSKVTDSFNTKAVILRSDNA